MSAQNVLPRAMLFYPFLPMVGAEYFWLKNICDSQKELDNKIDQKDKSWKNMEGLNS